MKKLCASLTAVAILLSSVSAFADPQKPQERKIFQDKWFIASEYIAFTGTLAVGAPFLNATVHGLGGMGAFASVSAVVMLFLVINPRNPLDAVTSVADFSSSKPERRAEIAAYADPAALFLADTGVAPTAELQALFDRWDSAVDSIKDNARAYDQVKNISHEDIARAIVELSR